MLARLKMMEREKYGTGMLYVINGAMDFRKTDGYIQFLHLALDHIGKAYKGQSSEWKKRCEEIRSFADRLSDENVRFTGSTGEEFLDYCENISEMLKTDVSPVPRLGLIKKEGDLADFIAFQMEEGRNLGFYYEETEATEKLLMHDLMDQLSKLKLEKRSRRYDISWYLCDTMYHEHVHDALNVLIQAAVYYINCSSTRECDAFAFDIMEMNKRLEYISSIIWHTRTVI